MKQLLSPKWLLSHVFVLAMLITMMSAGLWQLRRLDERKAQNVAVRALAVEAPKPLADLVAAGSPPEYTRALVVGEYLLDHQFLVANRSVDGLPGQWAVTPMVTADGTIVAVVRGFVPNSVLDGLGEQDFSPPSGTVTVTGLTFDSLGGGRVAVTDSGEVPIISRMDLDKVREVTGLDVGDFWVRLAEQEPAQPAELPIPIPAPALDDGPHLSYAFQWFFFSISTVVVYGLILRRRWQAGPAGPS